jgi:hypothetical protein
VDTYFEEGDLSDLGMYYEMLEFRNKMFYLEKEFDQDTDEFVAKLVQDISSIESDF